MLLEYFDQSIDKIYTEDNRGFYSVNYQEWSINPDVNKKSSQVISIEKCSEKLLLFLEGLLRKSESFFTTVQNLSRPTGGDFCVNLQIIKDDFANSKSHSLCVNISRLIPFFHIHVLSLNRKKDNFSKWDGLPERNKELEEGCFKDYVQEIEKFLLEVSFLNKFPDSLIHKKVDRLLTEECMNECTYYNAFFMGSFYTR